jgi:hypothetical protein
VAARFFEGVGNSSGGEPIHPQNGACDATGWALHAQVLAGEPVVTHPESRVEAENPKRVFGLTGDSGS